MHRQPAAPLADSHPVPGPTRALIDAIVLAVRTGDDPGIRVLLTQLAPLADTTALLLLRYRLGLSKGLNEASASSHPDTACTTRELQRVAPPVAAQPSRCRQ